MKRLLSLAAVVAAIALLVVVVLSTTDLTDDAALTAPEGPGEMTCELPRLGYVTCQRDVDVADTQRLEVTAPDTASAVVVRANAEGQNPASGRRVEPGGTRILVNAGSQGTYTIQARTRLLDLASTTTRLQVEIIDQ